MLVENDLSVDDLAWKLSASLPGLISVAYAWQCTLAELSFYRSAHLRQRGMQESHRQVSAAQKPAGGSAAALWTFGVRVLLGWQTTTTYDHMAHFTFAVLV